MAKSRRGRDFEESGINDSEKARAIDIAVSQIERQFGRGSIMRLGAGGIAADVKTIPTGSLGLDIAIGVGGRANYRNFWTRIIRKDYALSTRDCRSAEEGRFCCLRGCRTRFRYKLCKKTRR